MPRTRPRNRERFRYVLARLAYPALDGARIAKLEAQGWRVIGYSRVSATERVYRLQYDKTYHSQQLFNRFFKGDN